MTKIMAILDAISSPIVVIKPSGEITLVNSAWQNFAQDNDAESNLVNPIGQNYLTALQAVPKDSSDYEFAHKALKGIEAVKKDKQKTFELEYPCFIPSRKLWFLMKVQKVAQTNELVIIHLDITDRVEKENIEKNIGKFLGHELKTPLTSLQALLQLTEKSIINKRFDALKSLNKKALAATSSLAKLIENIVNSAQYISKDIQLNKEKTDLSNFIKELVSDYKLISPKYTFVTELKESVFIQADKSRLQEVFFNLLNNAVKFSKEGTVIKVTLTTSKSAIKIQVKDQGKGIKESQLPFIFDNMFKSHAHEGVEGYGLGLFLVKSIVELHQGKIICKSKVGRGTEFIITLPFK